ncbi:transglycosylase domain-containing protein [Corallococcus sp. M34]|uniref:transglycosylase domain-containing protein n=1 Tax=Citreicoccus inhibens TaxID=2849499 RepID=UPI001C21B46A|nr:biosynthetic peptidoglycan transglycosylase [Citreicoccus inhibens]MBU8895374.1 transglycosylase domain-containing protein [Citreicoccus inhibens]
MKRGIRRALLVVAVMGLVAFAYGLWLWHGTPDVSALQTERPTTTALLRLREHERKPDAQLAPEDWMPLQRMPLLACAVVKAEDRKFFRHGGFDWGEIRFALQDAVLTGRLRGASTITGQLARTLFLSPERTLGRKLRETFLVRDLERTLPKQRILELYLNTIEWGDGVYGAKAASREYFGKSPETLTPFEAATLASLIAAPRAPLVGPNLDRFTRAHARVLRQLYYSRLITRQQRYEAELAWRTLLTSHAEASSPVRFTSSSTPETALKSHDGLAPLLAHECDLNSEVAAPEAGPTTDAPPSPTPTTAGP